MRPFCAALLIALSNAVKALADSSLDFAAIALRNFFSTVRTPPKVLVLMMFLRFELRARFSADL